ncbi:MAG: hypothetical protein MUP55_03895 [Candidatus Aenigmarchaeota archaeon]|nr:hypothetical protein [Candidatus Aenigmarchaeota archaeon]
MVVDKEEHPLEFQYRGYKISGFTRPQDEMMEFDREHEEKLIRKCIEQTVDIYTEPNKFERRIARREDTPLNDTGDVGFNIIFTDQRPWYCAGSGGIGSAKVFWTPYSTGNKELRDYLINDDMCDNCKTLAHEFQHAMGGGREFDDFSPLIGDNWRVDNFPKGERLDSHIRTLARMSYEGCKEGWKPLMRRSRNTLCSINERNPDKLREILRQEDYFTEEQVDELLDCACGEK